MKASPELLLLLARKPAPDAAILDGYASGAIATRAAALGRQSVFSPSSAPRAIHRFKPRQRPRSPDREASRARRRKLGGSSALPPDIRCSFTEGQRAVLCVISGEVKRYGFCDFPIDRIGNSAGVGRTTAQTAIREAERLGLIRIQERPRPGRKHLPHLITIISPEWLTWIKLGAVEHGRIGSNSAKKANPTEIRVHSKATSSREVRPIRAWQGEVPASSVASPNADDAAGAYRGQSHGALRLPVKPDGGGPYARPPISGPNGSLLPLCHSG